MAQARTSTELESKRLARLWWWFDPQHRGKRCPAAATWEILRRAPFYQDLWREDEKARAKLNSLPPPQPDPNLPATDPRRPDAALFDPTLRYALDTLPEMVGPRFADLLLKECDPNLTWVELAPAQRAALRFSKPFLPRQALPEMEHPMHLGLIEVDRDPRGALCIGRTQWAGQQFAAEGCTKMLAFQKLPITHPTVFLTIHFDTRLSRPALERQLDQKLALALAPSVMSEEQYREWKERLMRLQNEHFTDPQAFHEAAAPPPPDPQLVRCRKDFLDKAMSGQWDEISKDKSRYPPLWQPDFSDTRPRTHQIDRDVRIIPEDGGHRVTCLIPTRCDIATVRARFHNAIRPKKKAGWLPHCQAHWRRQKASLEIWTGKMVPADPSLYGGNKGFVPEFRTVVRRPFDNAEPRLPAVKRAELKHIWLDLAAYDCSLKRADQSTGLLIGFWRAEISGLKTGKPPQSDPLTSVGNHKRALETRLRTLEQPPFSDYPSLLATSIAQPNFPFLPPTSP